MQVQPDYLSVPRRALDVEDSGCHIRFTVDGAVATADPPMQVCGSNSAPANWTLTLEDDGSLREDVVGSIVVANQSCFVEGTSTLTRE